MLRLLVRRILLALCTLWGVTILIFVLLQALPGDMAISLLGSQSGNPEAVARMRSYLGLDQPAHIQYFVWLGDVLQGDLGRSARFDDPVLEVLKDKSVNSLILLAGSMVIMFSVGVPLGILAALRMGGLLDRIGMGIIIVLGMMPVFWLSLMLIYIFALSLDWLPASRMYSFRDKNYTLSVLAHLILPAIATAAISLTIVARVVRSAMLEALQAPYMQALIARGIPLRVRVWRHAFRNILPITINISGLQIGWLFSGAVFTEVIFSWPGIGRLIYDAVSSRDIPVALGGILVVGAVFVLANLVSDFVSTLLDPRQRETL
jgi:peptide/nickel transport system permease protein